MVRRKQNREFWLSAVLNSVPDLLIAGAITIALDGGLLWFLGVLLGLQLVYLTLWLKHTIWCWFLYVARDKRRITRFLVDFLATNRFPVPDAQVRSAETYLDEVAGNETIDVRTRLLAAAELGAMRYLQSSLRFQEYFRLSMMYDEAIEKYSRRVGRP